MVEWLVIGAVAGLAALLEGCAAHKDGAQESESEEIETPDPTEVMIEIHSEWDQANHTWIVEGAMVVCTNAKIQGASSSKMLRTISNEYAQSKAELCHKDVTFEPLFDVCESMGECRCSVEGNEWKAYDKSKSIAGNYGMLKTEAYMVCTYGGGIIYATDDGQVVGKMEFQNALTIMDEWLKGNVQSDRLLEIALQDAAQYGEYTKVPRFKKPSDYHDNGQYDASIMAWSNYWNDRLENKYGVGGYIAIRPVVIKAFLAIESSYGTKSSHNGTLNIMQSMVPGDPCYWSALAKDPMEPGKSHYGSTEQVISATDLDGNVVNVSIYYDGNPSQNEKDWFDNGEWKVLEQTLSVDANGEYHHYYDKVTPDMSIAVGIGWYAYKMNEEFGQSSERNGVYKYNDGGDPDYMTKFDGIMGDLEDALH